MDSIIERLRKLIAHERSARSIGSIAEAESFAARVQEMLTRHKLSMSQVEYEEDSRVNPIGSTAARIHTVRPDHWITLLGTAVATNFFCQSLWHVGAGNNKACVYFVGRDADRETAAALFAYLYSLGLDLADKRVDKIRNRPDLAVLRAKSAVAGEASRFNKQLSSTLTRWKRDFLRGYATALYFRLKATREDLESSASTISTSLIRRDQVQIQEFCKREFEVKKKASRTRQPAFTGAFESGYSSGSTVSLSARAGLSTNGE